MKYKLTIRPSISPQDSCRLEDALVLCGYEVYGSGRMADGSQCDISFEERNEDVVRSAIEAATERGPQ